LIGMTGRGWEQGNGVEIWQVRFEKYLKKRGVASFQRGSEQIWEDLEVERVGSLKGGAF